MDANLAGVVAEALQDAASRTGQPEGSLVVKTAETVVWRDGSLGCPQPGMAYTQALVPGYRVRIQAGDRQLNYHAARTGRLVYCPAGRAQEPLPDDAV